MGSANSIVGRKEPSGDAASSISPYGMSGSSTLLFPDTYHSFYSGVVGLVQNNKYSDMIVICGDDRYPVHHAIVCPRSAWFEDRCQECLDDATPMRIWINPSECSSQVLAAVLTFLYTLDYRATGRQVLRFQAPQQAEDDGDAETLAEGELVEWSESDNDDASSVLSTLVRTKGVAFEAPKYSNLSPPPPASSHDVPDPDPGASKTFELAFHAQVFAAAQRFGIPSLCQISRDRFQKRLDSKPSDLELIACIREVYRMQQDLEITILKEDVFKHARWGYRIWKVLRTTAGWEDLVLDYPQFAVEMMRRL